MMKLAIIPFTVLLETIFLKKRFRHTELLANYAATPLASYGLEETTCQIAFWKKANLIFLFFLLHKLILPFYSFTLFCIILPMTMFVPEAELPDWIVCYIPALMSFLNILPAPKSFPFIIPYLLFENTMSVTKFNAMISGLFQLGSAYEWVVTKKSDRSSEGDLIALAPKGLKQQKAGSTPILDAAAMNICSV